MQQQLRGDSGTGGVLPFPLRAPSGRLVPCLSQGSQGNNAAPSPDGAATVPQQQVPGSFYLHGQEEEERRPARPLHSSSSF